MKLIKKILKTNIIIDKNTVKIMKEIWTIYSNQPIKLNWPIKASTKYSWQDSNKQASSLALYFDIILTKHDKQCSNRQIDDRLNKFYIFSLPHVNK